ncbi:nucleotide exchange factor GrpE [Buchnera aphidicola (Mindarus keteleerifoliae)]|uniref:nucleotide exchange factor GrpE n=1 Tax=Buchnera aphidicola TaxID=9 RepID=UPI0031B6EB90
MTEKEKKNHEFDAKKLKNTSNGTEPFDVENIKNTSNGTEPFDVENIKNTSNGTEPFDVENIKNTSNGTEPFDVENIKEIDFLKVIDDPEINELKNKILKSEIEFLKQKNNLEKKLNTSKYLFKKELEKNYKFCLENSISELLPVLDNIERALESVKNNVNKNFSEKFSNKLEKLISLILKTLNHFNVEVIKDKNVLFNPKIHQAISVQKSSEIKPNHIIFLMQKGYLLNKRLLRPAMVIVSE